MPDTTGRGGSAARPVAATARGWRRADRRSRTGAPPGYHRATRRRRPTRRKGAESHACAKTRWPPRWSVTSSRFARLSGVGGSGPGCPRSTAANRSSGASFVVTSAGDTSRSASQPRVASNVSGIPAIGNGTYRPRCLRSQSLPITSIALSMSTRRLTIIGLPALTAEGPKLR